MVEKYTTTKEYIINAIIVDFNMFLRPHEAYVTFQFLGCRNTYVTVVVTGTDECKFIGHQLQCQ